MPIERGRPCPPPDIPPTGNMLDNGVGLGRRPTHPAPMLVATPVLEVPTRFAGSCRDGAGTPLPFSSPKVGVAAEPGAGRAE